MSKEKIDNLVRQLSANEHISLAEYIERQYAVEFKEEVKEEEMMLRDDIRDKITDLITANFTDPRFIVQDYTWVEMDMDRADVQHLSDMLVIEFELDSIKLSEVMKWQKLSDAVSYIETALEETQPPLSDWI